MQTQTKQNLGRKQLDWEDEEDAVPRRSREEISKIVGEKNILPIQVSPWLVVKFQVGLTILFIMLSVLGNPNDWNLLSKSILAGGLVGVVPTALFALRLSAAKRGGAFYASSYVAALVSGELIKIVVTIALVVLFAWNMPDLKWLPMLGMYVLTLKCYWLAWFFKKKCSKK